jgi:hypothetical protein
MSSLVQIQINRIGKAFRVALIHSARPHELHLLVAVHG